MAPKNKQADRRNQKKASKVEEDEPQDSSADGIGGKFLEVGKALVMESFIVANAEKVKALLTDQGAPAKEPEAPKEAKEEESKEGGGEESEDASGEATNGHANGDSTNGADKAVGPEQLFESMKERLVWYNILGLGQPASGEDAKASWLAMKDLELDYGPRKSRKGTPGLDRVLLNLLNQLPQYIHILMVFMLLRTFLFISWFAMLPWALALQVASLLVPLELVPQCPVKFRVAGAMALNGLVLLLFLREVLWRTYQLEKILWVGLIAAHAYVVRPVEP